MSCSLPAGSANEADRDGNHLDTKVSPFYSPDIRPLAKVTRRGNGPCWLDAGHELALMNPDAKSSQITGPQEKQWPPHVATFVES